MLEGELAAVTRDLVEWSLCRATRRGTAHLCICSNEGGGACIGLPRLFPALPTVDTIIERAAGQAGSDAEDVLVWGKRRMLCVIVTVHVRSRLVS
jgi:hypothetical protein